MRRNTVVTILVMAAVAYVFYMIPRLAVEPTRVKEYEFYTDFYDDFIEGHIRTVEVVAGQTAEGEFKDDAPDDFDSYTVKVPPDEELIARLQIA